MPVKYSLKPGDYVVFGLSLLISSIIGFVFACRGDRLGKTPKDLLLAGGTMHPVPVAMSLLASSLNAVFIIGVPAEVYYYGVTYCYLGLALVAMVPVTAHFFVPIFRDMKMISLYEYLERRFNVYVRVLASATYVVAMSVFLGVVLYAPALTFSQVTGLPLFMAVAICGLVCTKYTVLGGIQAVIWVDVFQLGIVIIALIVLTSVGTADVGSSSEVWQRADDGGRLNFDKFDPDPNVRHSFWTQTIGMFFVWLPLFTTNQMMTQRYMTVRSTRDAKKALYIMMLILIVILALVVALGLVMYGYYYDCDPSSLNPPRIAKRDQIVPLFMMELLGKYEGVPGLFMASVFAAALSSVSSALNSVSAVILEDFVKVGFRAAGKKLAPKTAGWTSRAIALFFGFLMLGLSFIADHLSSSIIQIPATIWGTVGGPLLAVFILGFFVPCCNAAGAMCGLVVSLSVNLWLMIGNIVVWDKDPEPLNLNIGCQQLPPNGTTPYYSTVAPSMESTGFMTTTDEESTADQFYQISYAWYGLIGLVVGLVVGILVSWITEGIRAGCRLGSKLPPDTVFSFADRCCCCCPPSVQDRCRCGVPVVADEGDGDVGGDDAASDVHVPGGETGVTGMNEKLSISRDEGLTEANGSANPGFESSRL